MSMLTRLIRPAPVHGFLICFSLTIGSLGLAQDTAPANETAAREIEDVTILPTFRVKGDRLEDFGFRLLVTIQVPGPDSATVSEVWPNTAAAKAGLRPGDRVLKIDGKSFSMLSMALKPQKLQQRKWAELAAGKKSVSLSMEVRTPGTKESRMLTMTIPSPGPRWGSDKWSAPMGRVPAVVAEPGPLAKLAREVLDNGIWSVGDITGPDGVYVPVLGYEWRIVHSSGTHRIWVTQHQGKTEIALEHRSPTAELSRSHFRTSPAGAMEKQYCVAAKIKGKRREISSEEARAEFEREIDFWLNKVGRVTGRWPFEVLRGNPGDIALSGDSAGVSEKMNTPLAQSFLKLPVATGSQKELFFDALGKIGLDEDCWAFSETARSLDSDRVTTVRYDPSKPPEERSTLLKVDGKAPKPAFLQQWRNEGHAPLTGLGELPALSSVVDLNEVRIFADETTAVVFELPVTSANEEFPADKFLARFRVNKTHRGFEDFSVKLRESMRVAGIAKVTDAGFEARFQTIDPTLAPQLVFLKMGGGARVLLVKISRSFEATRTDFKRVVPFEEVAVPIP